MNSNWLPATVCIGAFVAGILIVVALAPLIRERREARRQAYLEQCMAAGFTAPQCQLLWDAKRAADDNDSDLWLAIATQQLIQKR